MKYQEKLPEITLSLLLSVVSLSFILNPLTNDFRIYQGVARLTDYTGGNIDYTWEIKPVVNRGLNYLLYKFSSLFASFGTPEYEITLKLVTLLIVIVVCYYFSVRINKNRYTFFIAAISLLSSRNFIFGQAEWWAVVFSLLVIGLFLEEKPYWWYLAGAGVTGIFLFKGITLLLVVPIVCTVYLSKDNWSERVMAGFVGSLMSVCLASIIFPHMVSDLILSSSIARVGMYSAAKMAGFLALNSFFGIMCVPCIISGIFAVFWLLWKKQLPFAILIAWITCLFIVYIQSEYFAYHYAVLVLPVILTLILLPEKVSLAGIGVIIMLFFIMSSYWSIPMEIENQFWQDKNQNGALMNEALPDLKAAPLLYLDPGDAPYYIGANSSCRYTSPLPFQRSDWNWNLERLSAYQETKVCIMNYTGKYIVTDAGEWMVRNTSDNKRLWEKINGEYRVIWNRSWNVYERKTTN